MCGEQSRVSHTPLYSRDFSIFVNSIRFVSAHCLHPLPPLSSPSYPLRPLPHPLLELRFFWFSPDLEIPMIMMD